MKTEFHYLKKQNILLFYTALKATLYLAIQESNMTRMPLARLLDVDEKEVRRILNPRNGTNVINYRKSFGCVR